MQTVADIKQRLDAADAEELAVLERSLVADTRKGVRSALEVAKRRLEAIATESARLAGMYSFQAELASGALLVGLDEVGRGPVAGPLTVG
ncbi:MAG: ribonuclease HII, partial [Raoultibacter sp.]